MNLDELKKLAEKVRRIANANNPNPSKEWAISLQEAHDDFDLAANPSTILKLLEALEIQREALEKYSSIPGMSVYATAALAKVKELMG